jgi:ElaB/YqjD/DUF883 family membrane-anchored ribosome-binding protein
MNDTQLEKKILQDTETLKKDLNSLVGDSTARIKRLEDNFNQATSKAKADLGMWVDDNVSQMNEGFEKLKVDARDTVVNTAATVRKDVGQGLSQYNAKAQEVADKVPGGFSGLAAKYPWVSLTIAILVGFLLGNLLKPTRHYPQMKAE